MKAPLLTAVFTLGVSALAVMTVTMALPASALAGDFYVDACTSVQGGETWTLALSTTGDHVAQFWREDRQRLRVGAYQQNGDDVVARIEDLRVHLHVASGDAAWSAGSAKGTFSCRYQSDVRPVRWVPSDQFILPPAPPMSPPVVASAPLDLVPPPIPGAMCDFEHRCYSAAPSSARGDSNHVPLHIENRAAYVALHIGKLNFQALVDTGASSLSLPETAADELIASGDASEGETLNVSHADGRVIKRRSIVVNSLAIGGHVVRNVQAVVEDDGAPALVGFDVLSQIAPRFTVNIAASSLDFE